MTLQMLLLLSTALSMALSRQDPAKPTAATMKAARVHEHGAPTIVEIDNIPRPTPAAGEALIRVHAAAVNPIDWKLASKAFAARGKKTPFTLGCDVSGVIESLGPGATDLKPGDEVYGYVDLSRGGAFAEYVALPASDLARKPKSIDHAHAAAVPLAALTAWRALFDTAKLQSGQTVLVHAGAGGVGHFAVQLAKAKGAKVIATASKDKLSFVSDLGAERVIDYKAETFDELVKDVDVVFDMIGGETLARSYAVAKEGGFVVSIVEKPSGAELEKRKLRGAVILLHPDAKELAEIGALIDAGKVKPHVSARFPLAETGKALALNKEGHTKGKIVIDVVPPKTAAPK
jgi:NADPH:quinone reductase-like Zn-dependent oxidoreductase